jgi:DNA-binding transcriptional ArsR family regulator
MKIMTNQILTLGKAIDDETRIEIMECLCCVWLSVNDVVDALNGKVNQPTVSHHLKKLEEANLVLMRQEGRNRFYTLNRECLRACRDVLDRVMKIDGPEPLIPPSQIPVIKS